MSLSAEYKKNYKKSIYYPVWQHIVKYVKEIDNPKIIEIGCGAGQLAKFLSDEGFTEYTGYDNNYEMLHQASANSAQYFLAADITKPDIYKGDYDIIIATEVLEHLKDDLALFKHIKKGTVFLFSLPTFDCNGHYRWFRSSIDIISRYFDCLKIIDLKRLKKPNCWFIGKGIVR